MRIHDAREMKEGSKPRALRMDKSMNLEICSIPSLLGDAGLHASLIYRILGLTALTRVGNEFNQNFECRRSDGAS